MVEETLGDSRHEMAYIELLATSPVMQGRGYASALIQKVVKEVSLHTGPVRYAVNHLFTNQAESQGRSTWLMSSNVANNGFYNSHGFLTKAKIAMGSDNPTWDRPPIVVCLVRLSSLEHC
jgi:GNAT superfamily N-acetyltransferase